MVSPALPPVADPLAERRKQILDAAFLCFSRKGFHQTTMQDISGQAGISVGLIYRYFENKHAVIAAMADEHKREIELLLGNAREAPTLLDALEIFFCCPGKELTPQGSSALVLDLFAEATRNDHVAVLLKDVLDSVLDALTQLVAESREGKALGRRGTPRAIAEVILSVHHGIMMLEVGRQPGALANDIEARQREVLNHLWAGLFPTTARTGPATDPLNRSQRTVAPLPETASD